MADGVTIALAVVGDSLGESDVEETALVGADVGDIVRDGEGGGGRNDGAEEKENGGGGELHVCSGRNVSEWEFGM